VSTSAIGIAQGEEGQQCSVGTSRVLIVLFSVTVFWASALLFLLEPMFAKMILPVFGGSPAVWNTSMVFFQSALFLAYIYSHVVANRSTGQSVLIHAVAIFVPLSVLPISIRSSSNLNTVIHHPAAAVLLIALSSIGLPFFLVATSAPLLQRWFSHTPHRDASDPHFLYAASNAGSLIGLALYPCIVEPRLRNGQQSVVWTVGYAVFLVLTLLCGLAAYRWQVRAPVAVVSAPEPAPSLKDKLLWAALAFVPASLLYAFTAQLSSDFPPIPLLWVIPLGLYLLTFVVAFSSPFAVLRRSARLLPLVIIVAMMLFLIGFGVRPGWWGAVGLLKLFCFSIIALAFHTELANRRTGRRHLTEYYLWVSAGGILGGLLNAFIAPVVFSDFWEYPLTLLIAAALLPTISAVRRRPVNLIFVGVAIAVVSLSGIGLQLTNLPTAPATRLLVLVAGGILCMSVPPRWAAAGLLLIALSIGRIESHPLYRGRSFFGKYQISTAAGGKWRILKHGATIHGLQRIVDSPVSNPPTSYYVPVRSVFARVLANKPSPNIAVVGLGAGTIGCYSTAGQSTTFFEIDPLVQRIAEQYFTFLSQCLGRHNIVLGDARLTIRDAAPHSFDVIVLDAFSSDAIPVHLLTREAFALYREKLTSEGVLLVHISNNYLELAPVVAASGARDGYSMLVLDDGHITPEEASKGRMQSRWALLVPSARAPEFESIGGKPFSGAPVYWTDDHSSLFEVVIWSKLVGFEMPHNFQQQ
jgi:hypothetical protein